MRLHWFTFINYLHLNICFKRWRGRQGSVVVRWLFCIALCYINSLNIYTSTVIQFKNKTICAPFNTSYIHVCIRDSQIVQIIISFTCTSCMFKMQSEYLIFFLNFFVTHCSQWGPKTDITVCPKSKLVEKGIIHFGRKGMHLKNGRCSLNAQALQLKDT